MTKLDTVRKLKVFFSISERRIIENTLLTEVALSVLMVLGYLMFLFRKKRVGFKLLSQVHRSTRMRLIKKLVEPFIRSRIEIAHVTLPFIRLENRDSYLGHRIMVLKKPGPFSELGVLHIMFNDVIEKLPSLFNMERLLSHYYLVLEPSWSGYCTEKLLQFTKYSEDIFVSCPEDEDYEFIERIDMNLRPLPFSARDWIDPRCFEQIKGSSANKVFDIVMNSHWGWGKRHYVLFEKLRMLPDVKIALIGVPWEGRNIEDLKELIAFYNIERQVTLFERISYEEVMRITSSSRLGILLSLKEGSNRAIPECLFCNVPVIVLSKNVGGVRKVINPQTGHQITEDELVRTIKFMLNNIKSYAPRKWALENISCTVTSSNLNKLLKNHALSKHKPWTRDIVPRSNAPESKYYNQEDEKIFKEANLALKEYYRN